MALGLRGQSGAIRRHPPPSASGRRRAPRGGQRADRCGRGTEREGLRVPAPGEAARGAGCACAACGQSSESEAWQSGAGVGEALEEQAVRGWQCLGDSAAGSSGVTCGTGLALRKNLPSVVLECLAVALCLSLAAS